MNAISISKKFRFLIGDVNWLDYGGKWYRKVGATRFHIIELVNMWEASGNRDTRDKYYVSLSEVDLTSPQLKQALNCCGQEDDACELAVAESLHSYGALAPLDNWEGSNAGKLLTQAKRESRSLDDPEAYESAMSKSVNALGSTAREYAAGDINSAIARGLQSNNPAARIMAQLQNATVRVIKQSSIQACPHVILVADHYREDGSCKCNDRVERDKMIKEWEYTEEDFSSIPIIS